MATLRAYELDIRQDAVTQFALYAQRIVVGRRPGGRLVVGGNVGGKEAAEAGGELRDIGIKRICRQDIGRVRHHGQADEETIVFGLIEDTAASANGSFSVAKRIVSEAKPGHHKNRRRILEAQGYTRIQLPDDSIRDIPGARHISGDECGRHRLTRDRIDTDARAIHNRGNVLPRGVSALVGAGVEHGCLPVVLVIRRRPREPNTIIEGQFAGCLPGILHVPFHIRAEKQNGLTGIYFGVIAEVAQQLIGESVAGIERVGPVDAKVKLTIDQSKPALDIPAPIPVHAQLNGVLALDQRGSVGGIKSGVPARVIGPCSKADSGWIQNARIDDVGNQVVRVVVRLGKQVAEVQTQPATSAFCRQSGKIVFRLPFGTVTSAHGEL